MPPKSTDQTGSHFENSKLSKNQKELVLRIAEYRECDPDEALVFCQKYMFEMEDLEQDDRRKLEQWNTVPKRRLQRKMKKEEKEKNASRGRGRGYGCVARGGGRGRSIVFQGQGRDRVGTLRNGAIVLQNRFDALIHQAQNKSSNFHVEPSERRSAGQNSDKCTNCLRTNRTNEQRDKLLRSRYVYSMKEGFSCLNALIAYYL